MTTIEHPQQYPQTNQPDSYYLKRIIEDKNPLTDLYFKIAAHRRKYRPQESARLAAAERFDYEVWEATQLTLERMDALMDQGQHSYQAWELCREEFAFLSAEGDEFTESSGERDPALALINGEDVLFDEHSETYVPPDDTKLFPEEGNQ